MPDCTACSDRPASGGSRSWLILAHCFNLDGRAASQTITDRLPRLMAKGVRPVVISAPQGPRMPGISHYRVLSPAPSGILFELRHVINRRFSSALSRRVLKTLLTLLLLPLYLPEVLFLRLDSQWSWFLTATIKGLFAIRRHRPALIYSTAGPPSTHWAGYWLSRLTGLPWLAEIHDPLVYDQEPAKGQWFGYRNALEGCISRQAKAVVYFTETALAKAAARHPFKGIAKVVRPGAAPPGFSRVEYRKGENLHIGHFGSLGPDRNLARIIEAIHGLIGLHPELRDIIRLDIYGAELDPASAKALAAFPLPGVVVTHGRLEYDPLTGKSGRQQVIEAMQRSDVLLLLHGRGYVCEEYIPSKVYEYLLAKRPILALVAPDSELWYMLAESGCFVADGEDLAATGQRLLQIARLWQQNSLPDQDNGRPYSVEVAVGELLKIEEQILT